MKSHCTLEILIVATVAGLVADIAPGFAEEPVRFSHPRRITNPFLPLGSLKQDVLESTDGRIERTVKPDVRNVFSIQGQTVEALAVEDREFEKGKLAEVTLDYFAQADDGTVYYLGEDVDEYKNGKFTGHSGAWLYGKDTTRLGVLMPGKPKIGEKFRSEDVPKITREDDEILSMSEIVTVPSGTYRGCLKIKEKPSDGWSEYKYYAPGVGCVKEEESDAHYVLTSHTASAAMP